jgi:DNA-binding PadR family transcriptional regulator
LEAAGWITSAWEEIDESKEGRRRRRYYRLTGLGTRQAEEALLSTLSELSHEDSPFRRRGQDAALPKEAPA